MNKYTLRREKYRYKPLRAFLLSLALAGDVAAVITFAAGFADHMLFIAAAVAVAVSFILRRISLYTVWTYVYNLQGTALKVTKEYIGKSKVIFSVERVNELTPCGKEDGIGLHADGGNGDYYKCNIEGRDYVLLLDRYAYAMLAGKTENTAEVNDDISR